MPSVRILFAGLLAVLPAVQAGAVGITAIPSPPVCTPTPKATPPSTLHCGRKRATLANPQIIDTPTTSSLADCASQCLATSNCISFGFDAGSGACPLLSSTLKAQGWKRDRTSTFVYFNIQCWACPPKPYNGDFETGTTADWEILYQSAASDDSGNFSIASPGFNASSYAGELSTTQAAGSPNSDVLTIGQTIKVHSNRGYVLSFVYNAMHTSQDSQVGTNFFPYVVDEANSTILAGQHILLTGTQSADTAGHTLGTWNYVDLIFNSGNNNEVQATFNLFTDPDNTTVLLDNIRLHPLVYPPYRFVLNGLFESGSLRPWTISLAQGIAGLDEASVSLSSPGPGSSGSAVLLHASQQSNVEVSATLSQQLSIPQLSYEFNFHYQWLESSGGSGVGTLTVEISNSQGTFYFQQISFDGSKTDSLGNPPGVWNGIQGYLNTPGSDFTISLSNMAYNSTSSRDVLVAEIELFYDD